MRSRARSISIEMLSEILILSCGHGDTTLIRLPGDRWVLIDCNLTRDFESRFFELLENRGIRRIELVCLSHPHGDHFRGMARVLEYFSHEGREIGAFCDSGLDPRQICGLLQKSDTVSPGEFEEYCKLWMTVEKLRTRGLKYVRVDKNTKPLLRSRETPSELIPCGPDPSVHLDQQMKTLRYGGVRCDLNRISLVLLYKCMTGKGYRYFLFPGDASAGDLDAAVEELACEEFSGLGKPAFDGVKVPHHGSPTSLSERLLRSGSPAGSPVAAFSVGTRCGLPDRRVLQRYLEEKWSVLLTTRRTLGRRSNGFLEVSNRGRGRTETTRTHDIQIKISDSGKVEYSPDEARIGSAELPNYESAGS